MHWFLRNWKEFCSRFGHFAPRTQHGRRSGRGGGLDRLTLHRLRSRQAVFESLSSREMLSASPVDSYVRMLAAGAPSISASAVNSTYSLAGSNTYTGPVQGGTLTLEGANYNGSASGVTLSAGTLALNSSNGNTTNGASLTVGSQNIGTQPLRAGAVTFAPAIANGGSTGILNLPIVAAGTSTLTLNNNPTLGTGSPTYSGVLSGAGALTKVGAGTLTLTDASTTYPGPTTIGGGTLRLSNTAGNATIGTGVTTTVPSGATLELAGTVSGLSDPSAASRAHIVNNGTQGSTGGLLVSGTNQQVGAIDGTGNTMVSAGSDLTANHIVQNALVIGGTGSAGIVTIGASDASGTPLGQPNGLALAGSLTPSGPFGAGAAHSTVHVASFGKMVSAHDPSISASHIARKWAMVSAGGR